jgi:hypothetical protein
MPAFISKFENDWSVVMPLLKAIVFLEKNNLDTLQKNWRIQRESISMSLSIVLNCPKLSTEALRNI